MKMKDCGTNSKLTVEKNTLLIVWALYDDAESSCQKTIKKHFDKKIIVCSIRINDPKILSLAIQNILVLIK
ncbi:hypothetical protein [Mycoplasma putrefaciens]|uniref:hypothetical protein n=1 Tax=Mycoplasma putrefaciens TaxID=2123 RepID=UPI0005B9B146|nr:hypothetical protein [Mycoplasma putrefaciens]